MAFSISKVFRGIYLLLNLIAVIWLALCKMASFYDTSDSPSLMSLLSFTSFFAFLTNVIFIVIWLFSAKKLRSLISIIAIIFCWNFVRPITGLNYFGNNKVESNEGGLKVMSWNVHMFDLGEWTNDETSKAKIINLIKEENPDVLCLEEFYWDVEQPSEPYTAILQQLGYPYVKMAAETTLRKNRMTVNADKSEKIYLGNAIFSKYPLQNDVSYQLSRKRKNYKMLSVDLVMDSSRIFNINVVHLTSVGFGSQELEYIEEVKAKGVNIEDKSKSKHLLRKLMHASAERAVLANQIDSIKRFTDYPIIICGDFNDIPGSYVYRKVKGNLADAFEKKGAGLGRTYRHIFPTLRIDYILFDESALKAEGYLRRDVDLSDHYPIIANFSIRER